MPVSYSESTASPVTSFGMFDRLSPGYFGNLQLARRMSAVTAACLLVRRKAWDQVHGMDATSSHRLNDVDFCLRLREAGWEIVWHPYAEMYHHESTTRGPDTGPRAEAFKREVDYMESRWGFDFPSPRSLLQPEPVAGRRGLFARLAPARSTRLRALFQASGMEERVQCPRWTVLSRRSERPRIYAPQSAPPRDGWIAEE